MSLRASMERYGRSFTWWHWVILAVSAGLLFVALPLLVHGQYRDESSTDSQAAGTVVSVRDTYYRSSRGCEVEFRAGGTEHVFSDQCGREARPGDSVEVHYQAADPAMATLASQGQATLRLWVGLGAVVACLLTVVVGVRAERKLKAAIHATLGRRAPG